MFKKKISSKWNNGVIRQNVEKERIHALYHDKLLAEYIILTH